MNRFILVVGLAAAVVAGFAGIANAQNIKEGKWTMTMVTQMAGMEEEMADMTEEDKAMMGQMMGAMGSKMGMDMKMGFGAGGMTTTVTQCMTKDDPVPESKQNKACKSTHSTKGNTVSFTTSCPDGDSTGKITYQNDSMKGIINSHSAGGDATIEISGKYVGPCDK